MLIDISMVDVQMSSTIYFKQFRPLYLGLAVLYPQGRITRFSLYSICKYDILLSELFRVNY